MRGKRLVKVGLHPAMKTPPSLSGLAWGYGLIFCVGLAFLSLIHQTPAATLLPTFSAEFAVEGNLLQRVFYAILVASLAFVILYITVIPAWQSYLKNTPAGPIAWISLSVISFTAVMYMATKLLFSVTFIICVIGFATLSSRVVNLKSSRRRTLVRFFALLLGLTFAFVIYNNYLRPLLGRQVVESGVDLTHASLHYALTVLPGLEGLDATRANYGWGMILQTVLAEEIMKPILGAYVDLVTVVRIHSVLLWLVIILWFVLLARARVAVIAIGFLLVSIPQLSMIAVDGPNATGSRYLPLGVGVLILISIWKMRLPIWIACTLLAAAAGGVLLMAPDAGLSLLVAGAVMILLSSSNSQSGFRRLIPPAAMIFIAVIVFFAGQTLLLGLKGAGHSGSILDFLTSGLGGNMGMTSTWTTLATALLTTSLLFFMDALRRWRMSRTNSTKRNEAALNSALAIMAIMWTGYFVNRMDQDNSWFVIVLVVLLITISPWNNFRKLQIGLNYSSVLACASLIFGLLAGVMVDGLAASRHYLNVSFTQLCDSPSIEIEGKCLTGSDALGVREKLQHLGTFDPDSTLVFSVLPTEVRLQGYNSTYPWYDFFAEVQTSKDINEVREYIKERSPLVILIDDPEGVLSAGMSRRLSQLAKIAHASGYSAFLNANGWVHYKKR